MKRYFFLCLLAFFCSVVARAEYDFSDDATGVDIYYNILSDGNSVEITYGGDKYDSTKSYTGDFIVPESVSYEGNTYTVTAIGDYAFYKCTITSITFPTTITSLGVSAFYWCKELTSFTIPDGLTSVTQALLRGCTELTSVTIPNSVTTIEANAFMECSSLPTVTLPSSLTTIGDEAFCDCSALSAITLPDGLLSIGSGAFVATGITTIEFPSTLTTLGGGAFEDSGLQSVFVPKTITNMGGGAFAGAHALTDVTLEDGMTDLSAAMFSDCSSLEEITIPNSITSITMMAFGYCTSLRKVTLGDDVTTIELDAFYECGSLESINIPSSMREIGEGAFLECSKLNGITLPEGLTTIGKYAFEMCYALEKITIPSSVTELGDGIFLDCPALSSVTFAEGIALTAIPDYMFTGCAFESIDLPNTITTIGNSAFSGCEALQEVNLPANVKTIDDMAFQYCYNVSAINLPNGLEYIGDEAFILCMYYSGSAVTIPASVTHLGQSVFQECEYLPEATILAKIDTLQYGTFAYCSRLTTVSIPKTVTTLGNRVFYYCSKLASLTSLNRDAPICGTNVFSSVPTSTCVLYVPEGSEETYSSAPIWQNFKNIVGIEVEDEPDEEDTKFVEDGIYYQYVDKEALTVEVTYETTSFNYYTSSVVIPSTVVHDGTEYTVIGIGENAFRHSPELTAITLPEGITYMSVNACYECTALIDIDFPSTLTAIGDYAFYACSALTSLTIPATITSIGKYSFSNCSSLSTVTFEDGEDELFFNDYAIFTSSSLTSVYLGRNLNYDDPSISHGIFYGYTNLKDITISESVTTLGKQLFYNTAIETITLPKSITDIGDYTFSYCSRLKTVIISEGMTKLGRFTFSNCAALTDILLPEGLINMGYSAFSSCTALEEVAIPSTVTSAESAFNGCTKLKTVKLPEGVAEISNSMFNSCTSLTEIDLPSSIGDVGNYAFAYCTNLERVTFMEGENSYYMGMYAFSGCVRLNSILLPSNVRYIGSGGFYNCTGLKKVVFPNQTGNNSSPFQGCSSLEEVILCAQSQSLNSYISANQFNGCTSLAKIYVLSDVAPNVANANAFTNVPTETCVVYVPVGSRESYIDEDSKWSVFANIVELSEPLPVTYCVGNVTTESAQINGLVAVGSIDVTEVGFEYWAEGDDTPTVIVVSNSFTATDELHATLADLAYGMTYTYRVYAKTASETFYGDEVTFTLPIDGAKVFTLEASSITGTTAVLNGRLVLPDDESVAEQGFEYWAEGGETQSVTVSGNSLTYTLENLTPETTYTYYAFATLASGSTIYGEEVEFTTLEATETGITNVEANGLDDENIEGYYTPDGRAIGAPQRGVNIIRYNDGTTKKVLIK